MLLWFILSSFWAVFCSLSFVFSIFFWTKCSLYSYFHCVFWYDDFNQIIKWMDGCVGPLIDLSIGLSIHLPTRLSIWPSAWLLRMVADNQCAIITIKLAHPVLRGKWPLKLYIRRIYINRSLMGDYTYPCVDWLTLSAFFFKSRLI